MRRLDRYIVSTVSSAMLLVLLVVLSLDLVFAFIAEMDELKNNYQVLQAIKYVGITIPRRIYDYLPLAAFIGSLVGLGVLANTSELTVMRAAGISVSRIVWSTMKPALAVVLLSLFIGEFIAPHTERIAQTQRALEQGAAESIASEQGIWHREGNIYMHFNAVEPKGVLHGVSLFEFNSAHELVKSSFAKRALYQGDYWILQDLKETYIKDNETTRMDIVSRRWDTELSPAVLGVLIIKPEYLSIRGLYTYVNYLVAQELNANTYLMAFWKKVLQPVATGVLVLVAISFIFGPLRSVTMGFRVFCGIIVGLLFKYMQDLLGPASLVFGFNPILATLVPIIISGILGVILLKRVK
ncbi:LPS export ABC transporter permease LptG [Hahella sp. CCB-MM4]|uniref:LPS export ABC transporter permease LptG n=1 Tax=Hahella sp. (strain CCB-MM4) TaxID=1926491 RepID=UPI000B9ACC92|nr:LPS export ABC transporter permease LptG [Hahella sp. CCB-MM4]OZG72510.1 LPS export ABC transporter permease LptG [Hahella sp. CCB-MM4]